MKSEQLGGGFIRWIQNKSSESRFLIGSALFLSVLICGLISYIYYQQNQIVASTTDQLEQFREARIDLARGYLYIILSTNSGSPYDVRQGQALLEQAVNSMDHAARTIHGQSYYLTPEDQAKVPAVAGFKKSMEEFRLYLADWSEYSDTDPAHLVSLRIAYFDLDRQADQMDRSIRQSISGMTARMDLVFYVTMILSVAFLMGVCLIIYYASRLRDRADLAFRTNDARLRAFLDHIPDLVWVKDDHGRYLTGNAQFLKATEIDEKSLGGIFDHDIWPPILANKYQAEDRQVLETGQVLRITELISDKKGEKFWFETIKAPVRQANGGIIGTIGIARNIHDRKLQEDRIRQLNDELEERVKDRTIQLEAINQELEAFNYSVSHDLRAPLRGIDGLSRLIMEDGGDNLSQSGKDALEKIFAEILHMDRLIEGLLNLSRISRSEINISRVDLTNIAFSISKVCRRGTQKCR
jgi:PAS domain S-box-containing protein